MTEKTSCALPSSFNEHITKTMLVFHPKWAFIQCHSTLTPFPPEFSFYRNKMNSIMKATLFHFFLLSLLVIAACCKQPLTVMEISWSGDGGIETVEWGVDGNPVGKGLDGYKTVLHRIDSMADHARIRCSYSYQYWNEEIEGFNQNDPFPFKLRQDLRVQFDEICRKKDLTIQLVRRQ